MRPPLTVEGAIVTPNFRPRAVRFRRVAMTGVIAGGSRPPQWKLEAPGGKVLIKKR
ncbi:hypothetical protein MESS4_260078 [Mesorhizobium sp. STM 4661]|nr:hypothetical protein MESS4_260078 [Mesorhizobium sp. STM 4661]